MRRVTHLALIVLLVLVGCQKARRYPSSAQSKDPAELKKEEPLANDRLLWSEPVQEFRDIPIVFVPNTAPEWHTLPRFWNMSPPVGGGMATLHIGASPLAAVAAILAADHLQGIKIKVPLGLPDPTAQIPDVNPPTYARWRLGQQLFFEEVLGGATSRLSCASCHQPTHGYTQDFARFRAGEDRNTLSLINVIYNRSQFWDGRVQTLEETIFRPGSTDASPAEHNWGNLARTLIETPHLNKKYTPMFSVAFGVVRPTQDTAAKALATYMRTLLSGNSIIDRTEAERQRLKEPVSTVEQYVAVLDDKAVAQLGGKTAKGLATDLKRGETVFREVAGCVRCHGGPLYTDGQFYNIGLDGSDAKQLAGVNLGRFAQAAYGLKSPRLIGAYRTPTLRALPRTTRYMHDGSLTTLGEVVEYFDQKIDATHNRYLCEMLRGTDGRGQRLHLDPSDIRALVLYLRALDGDAIETP